MNSPPKKDKFMVFLPSDNTFRLELDEYVNYYITGKPRYAITYTMAPDVWRQTFKKDIDEVRNYFSYTLSKLGYNGLGVIEYTKARVPHLHGMCTMDNEVTLTDKVMRRKTGFYKYYLDPRIDVIHLIDKIKSEQQLKQVARYITKSLQPLSVMDYYMHEGGKKLFPDIVK